MGRGVDRKALLLSLVILASVAVVIASACAQSASSGSASPSPPPTVDRSDPEAVLRAYFAAWADGDWGGVESFMDESYAGMEHEPLESLHIASLELRRKTAAQCEFDVVFDVKVQGAGLSMTDGRYPWSYELTWDAARASWLITNYGFG